MRFPHIRSVVCLVSILANVQGLPAYPIDVHLNGALIEIYDTDELTDRLRSLGENAKGVSLLEILPLFYECDRLEAIGAGETRIWTAEEANGLTNLTDAFHDALIVADLSGWSLDFLESHVADLQTIRLSGDLLGDSDLEAWIGWEGTSTLRREIESFGNYHDLDIKIVEVANIRAKLLTIYRAGGRMPDVIMIQADYLPSLLELDMLQPVDSIIDATHDFRQPDAFASARRNWAVPFYFDAQLVVYNPGMVSPPVGGIWNLEDFESALEVLEDEFDAPASWNVYSAYWLTPFLFAFGRDSLTDGDGRIPIDDAATSRAVEYLLSLYTEGMLRPLERDAMFGRFLREESGLVLTGSYSIPMLERIGVSYGLAPLPSELVPIHDYKGFAITRRSRHSLLARRLVQHLSSTYVQRDFCLENSKLPARITAFPIAGNSDTIEPGSNDFALYVAASRGTPIPPTSGYTKYKNTLWQLLRLIFAGKLSISDALEEGQKIISGGSL